MNLANHLTLSRLVMAFLLLLCLSAPFPFAKTVAFLVFIVAGATDYFDGRLARERYGVTSFGQLMDPLTDKVMVCAAFVGFVELGLVNAVVVVVIITREFLVTGLRQLAVSEGKIIAAGRWGKHKTLWQIVAISLILLGLAVRDDLLATAAPDSLARFDAYFAFTAQAVSVAVAVITVISGWMYLVEHRDLILREL